MREGCGGWANLGSLCQVAHWKASDHMCILFVQHLFANRRILHRQTWTTSYKVRHISMQIVLSLNAICYPLFALAFRHNAFNLVESAICTWCLFYNITPDFACSAALAGLGCSPLDALVRSCSVAGQSGVSGLPLHSGNRLSVLCIAIRRQVRHCCSGFSDRASSQYRALLVVCGGWEEANVSGRRAE